MELETIHLPWTCIDCADLLICKVCLEFVALKKFWTVAALLDEWQGKHSLLPQLDYSFQYSEPTVKDNKLGSVTQWFFNCFWWLLTRHVLDFSNFHLVQHPRQTTGNCMIFVYKRPWISWEAHESGSRLLVQTLGHWLVQTRHPIWREFFVHVCVPLINESSQLIQAILVGGRRFVCVLEGWYDSLKSRTQHILPKSHLISLKHVDGLCRPRNTLWIKVCRGH